MHTFFATSNLGGGGTNVSRFVMHFDKIKTKHIGILLNYYYLSLQCRPAFDTGVLRDILNHKSIKEFLRVVKQDFIDKKRQPENLTTLLDDEISQFLLDSGTGNIIRDLISSDNVNKESLTKLIEQYLNFSETLKFNLLVAFDYALKYTHKGGEGIDALYKEASLEFVNSEKANIELLQLTIDCVKRNNHKQNIIAPLHGFNFDSFKDYLNAILEIENKNDYDFFGFAIGGIADPKKLTNTLWKVPDNFNQKEKALWIVSNLTKNTVEKIGNRPLHILGAGNIFSIPLITHFGSTSSDCHSAWRRANDGDKTGETKMLIPLINSKLQFIDNSDAWDYIKLSEIETLKCDCPVCAEYEIENIKNMISSANKEEFYFGKILIFIHALYQYDYTISFMNHNKETYLKQFLETPSYNLNKLYNVVLSNIT